MQKFELGQILATPAALEVLEANNLLPQQLIRKHMSGDWGVLAEADAQANNNALREGQEDRILSSYPVGDGKVWVITEWDRSATTILLPSDY